MIIERENDWKQHGCFEESDKFFKENQKLFLKFCLQQNNNAMLLDLGCSDGEFTKRIAAVVGTGRIYGIEIDKNAAEKAKEKGIIVENADLNFRFPFSNEVFDVVSANQTLEHVWNTDNFFREINRVLKTGGYAVISTPNLSSLHSIFFILLGRQTPVIHLIDKQVGNFLRGIETYGHYKAFNIPALRDLANYYGFEVETIKGYGFYFLPLSVQELLGKILGRYAIYLTMRIKKTRNLE